MVHCDAHLVSRPSSTQTGCALIAEGVHPGAHCGSLPTGMSVGDVSQMSQADDTVSLVLVTLSVDGPSLDCVSSYVTVRSVMTVCVMVLGNDSGSGALSHGSMVVTISVVTRDSA